MADDINKSKTSRSATVSAFKRLLSSDWSYVGEDLILPKWSTQGHLWDEDFQADLQRMSSLLVLGTAAATTLELLVAGNAGSLVWLLQAVAVLIGVLANVLIRFRAQGSYFLHLLFGSTVLMVFLQSIIGATSHALWALPIIMAWSMVLPSSFVVLITLLLLTSMVWLVPTFRFEPANLMLILAGLFSTYALKSQLTQVGNLAMVDPLTGALNRRFFKAQAKRLLDEYSREGRPAALIYIDLDGFKAINDRLGHGAGDRILKAVTTLVQRRIRKTDFFYRMGGDEFVLILCNTPPTNAADVMGDLQRQILEIDLAYPHKVSACFGVSSVQDAKEPADWLAAADRALKEAKAAGPATIYQLDQQSGQQSGHKSGQQSGS